MTTQVVGTTGVEDHDERLDPDEVARVVVALCALLAGGIHLAVAPEHASVSLSMTGFFVAVGLGQLTLAAALRWRITPSALAAVVLAHLVIVSLYIASRTVDLPFIPPHDVGHEVEHLPVAGGVGNGIPIYPGSRIEPVEPVDLLCLLAELMLIGAATSMLTGRMRGLVTSAMLLLVGGIVLVRFTIAT